MSKESTFNIIIDPSRPDAINVSGSVEEIFTWAFNHIARDVHYTAKSKGWWDEREKMINVMGPSAGPTFVKLVSIALQHSELSEAAENIRHGCPPDDKVPEFTGEAAEYADAIIRIMDTAFRFDVPVAAALVAKAKMNQTRAHMHGGKKA